MIGKTILHYKIIEKLGQAEFHRKIINAALSPRFQPDYKNTLEIIRTNKDKQELKEIFSQGQDMTIDENIAFALSEI